MLVSEVIKSFANLWFYSVEARLLSLQLQKKLVCTSCSCVRGWLDCLRKLSWIAWELQDILIGLFSHERSRSSKVFLGIEVARNSQGFYLTQRKYVLDILTETELLGAKPALSPMEQNHQLSRSRSPLLQKPERYWHLVGRLIYLAVTRPDLSYSVHTLAQYMQSPRQDNWDASLHVVKYLKSNPGQGILLTNTPTLQLHGWWDSDWAACPLTRRSLTGYFVQLGDSPISWKTKKQDTASSLKIYFLFLISFFS